jgi:GT2 family glycosyltransferase
MEVSLQVSVVIPTLNRGNALLNTVQGLLNSPTRHLKEIVVVDQSDEKNTALLSHADTRLLYKHVRFKSLPRARNYGVAKSKAELILFLDDDVAGLESIVDAHALAHMRTGADVITGPILNKGEGLISVSDLSDEDANKLQVGKALILNLDRQHQPLFAPGGNSSYRRSMIQALGGFDENFIGNAVGEDAEMSHRVMVHGGTIIFDPAASVVHLQVPSGGCRNESDELKRAEISILNTHYLIHKTGRSDLASSLFAIIRTWALNRRLISSTRIDVIAIRVIVLCRAWWKARARTARLLGAGSALAKE